MSCLFLISAFLVVNSSNTEGCARYASCPPTPLGHRHGSFFGSDTRSIRRASFLFPHTFGWSFVVVVQSLGRLVMRRASTEVDGSASVVFPGAYRRVEIWELKAWRITIWMVVVVACTCIAGYSRPAPLCRTSCPSYANHRRGMKNCSPRGTQI